MTLGQRLRFIRKQNRQTLKDVSAQTGISLQYIASVERDQTKVSLSVLQKLCEGYNMSVVEMMSGITDLCEPASEAIPESLATFLSAYQAEYDIDDDWKQTLLNIRYRGNHPKTKREWLEVYLFLSRLFNAI